MAERVFDYQNISQVYNNMQKITGNEGDPESIAGVLTKADKDYHDVVSVCDEALYGDLANQLMLDWENTASSFPNFVNNFNNWATLVAQSAGQYQQFEQDVQGFRSSNPLGSASNGLKSNYIDTSIYANALTGDQLDDLASYAQFHQLTGATYVDTGMVSYAKKKKVANIVDTVLTVGAAAVTTFSAFKYIKQLKNMESLGHSISRLSSAGSNGRGKATVQFKGVPKNDLTQFRRGFGLAGKNATAAADNLFANNKFFSRFANTKFANFVTSKAGTLGKVSYFTKALATNSSSGAARKILVQSLKNASASPGILWATGATVLSPVARKLEGLSSWSTYSFDYYGSGGSNGSVVMGDEVTINNQPYYYIAHSTAGTDLYSDDNGNLFYQNGNGQLVNASFVDASGKSVNATLDNVDDTTVIYAGAENMGAMGDLDAYKDSPNSDENYTEYYDNLSSNFDSLMNETATASN